MNNFEVQTERFREKHVEGRGSSKEQGENCMMKSFVKLYHRRLSQLS